ncbi:hypothetical protein [Halomonas litopenaei]|uniref:hypothetical protein n=1 Tax=Halomonas litopenaei TaxID=2109328 RepID=UPI003FA0721D
MQDSLVLTIFSSVDVFVVSQFFMKFVLDPAVALKESLGEMSHFFLFNQAKITNAHGSDDLQEGVKRLSAQLLAKKEAVPGYSVFSRVLSLPKETALIEAAKELNLISYHLMQNTPAPGGNSGLDSAIVINRSMRRIQEKTGTRVSYE